MTVMRYCSSMRHRRRVSAAALACFAWLALGVASRARAEDPPAPGATKDDSNAKTSDGDKKKAAAKSKKRRKPAREGDEDERGVVYSR